MSFTIRHIVFLMLAGIGTSFAAEQQPEADPVAAARKLAASLVTAKTPSGRFVAVGSDRVGVYDFARWAEDVALRFENLTNAELPPARDPLIRVQFFESKDAEPDIARRALFQGHLSHSIRVLNYEPSLVETILHEINFCLISTVIATKRLGSGQSLEGVEVPLWLSYGISQNMYPEMRKRNSEEMLTSWQEGRMIPLQSLLSDETGTNSLASVNMARGLLVGWFMSLGRDTNIPGKAIDLIAEHGTASYKDMADMLASAGIADADAGWDAWMLRQKRRVYLPGRTSVADMRWFKRQLLIYPEDSGIALTDGVAKQLAPADLIDLKSNQQIRSAVSSRLRAIQLRSAGKDDGFRAVAQAYCTFFDGVVKERADWRLKGYLEAANEKLREFEIATLTLSLMSDEEEDKESVKR